MKINKINIISFKSIREDRNTTEQLKNENDYSLTENNQKKISKAIDNLGQEKGAKNIEFLLSVADNLKYGTNIQNNVSPRNDWKLKLKTATEKSLSMSDPITRERLNPEFSRIFNTQKPLSEEEKQILQSKENILKNIDETELEEIKNPNMKNLAKNLDYFIISSEIPLHQKKYILNRFEYLLSPEYKINPQLQDKKTTVLAEMLNDLVVTTEDSKFPNTKAINQKSHGMCAAISIARKLMSYEYKPKFVDSIMSELDDTDSIMVYDLAHIGENKKVPVQKTYIDFDDAMNKGYRIIDASTTQWMNIADMFGVDNKNECVYTAFDGNHFGTFTDTHYHTPFNDEGLQAKQSYYQALLKAKENIDKVKIDKEEKKLKLKTKDSLDSDLDTINSINTQISKIIKSESSSILLSSKDIHKIVIDILNLEKPYSSGIEKIKDETKKYSYIHNEENNIKDNKIKSFLKDIYNIEISDKNVSTLRDLAEMSNSITESINPKSTLAEKVRFDRKLFNAAAAYRTSMIMSLADNDLKTDLMVHYNIPDTENFTSNTITRYIEKIKNGDTRYINYFSNYYGVPADKKVITKILTDLKQGCDYSATKALDDMYAVLGIGSRKEALLGQVKFVKNLVERNDKETIRIMSATMGVSKNKAKILSNLQEYERILSHKTTEKDYSYILNKMGIKDRYAAFADTYRTVIEAIKEPEIEQNKAILQNINLANGLDENAPIEELEPIITEIAELFNKTTQNLQTVRDSLIVFDESGIPIDSANPNHEIIKKMENAEEIIPATELLRLQVRYDAIDKIRSQDEFSSSQGKISDPTLYKYSKAEKETLKKIEKSINKISSNTNRELIDIYKEIKKPYEENARKIGMNMGLFWTREGHSGLYSFQQAKILQQLTDKPYQILSDFDKAIDIIKNSPNSGISSTSVFHNEPGWHAQYVSEIAEHNGKEILYHDNTWGASEHENVWVDSEGLLRTDYSDNRGGELGYITDSRFRNGNYIENLLEKTGDFKAKKVNSKNLKKLNKDSEDFKFELISDIIVPGISKEAEDTASGIKDNIFIPDTRFLNSFEMKLSNMTVGQIRAAKIKHENIGLGYHKELEDINKRLEVTPLNKGIESKADYDALKDDDPLKVVFEKAAFEMSYNFVSQWKELAKIDTMEGLKKIKQKQLKTANENFDYAFAKSPDILLAYALNKNKSHVYHIVNNALKNNNIDLSDEQKTAIIKNSAVFEKDEKTQFDGSLAHTIDFMVNKILNHFDEQVPATDSSLKAKAEIKKNLTEDISKGLYFAKKDLLKDTPSTNAIRKYIDKKYKPQTDEEFVEIYKHLQDMTTEEFKKETSDRTPEDMAIKNITGYDVLKKYKASNSKIESKITNLVYQKYLVKNFDSSKTSPHFQYKKLQKKYRGAYYTEGRTYDDLYSSFKYSLSNLNYEKLFNKYKDINKRKSGATPAYPKLEILDNKFLEKEVKILDTAISETANNIKSRKLNLQAYEITDKVSEFLNKIPDDKKLTQSQRQILQKIISEFISDNFQDPGLEKSIEAALNMQKISRTALSKEYKILFKDWQAQVNAIKNLNSEKELKEGIKSDLELMKNDIRVVLCVDVPPRFRSKIVANIDKFADEILKESKSSYDLHAPRRILKEKLSTYSKSDVKPEDIENLFDIAEVQIEKIKTLKNAYMKNTKSLSNGNKKVINSMLAFMEQRIDEKYLEEFPDFVMNFMRTENEFDDKTFRQAVSKQVNIPEILPEKDHLFEKFSNCVKNYNKTYKTSNKYKQKLEENSAKIEKICNEFIEKNVRPEYMRSVATLLTEYTKKQFTAENINKKEFDIDKWIDFKIKITEDLNKYHYLRYPEELLDRFTELCAKDSEITKAKNIKEKNLLETERDFAKSTLKNALAYSSLIEMQEILVDSANELGNPALATKKFKNYDTEYVDPQTGTVLTLADPKIINIMVRSLTNNKTIETSIMFIEKLGLTDQFVEQEEKMFDVEQIKKKINRLVNILKTTDKQTEILEEELAKFSDDMNIDEFLEQIDRSKETIIRKTHNLSRQKNVRAMLSVFDNIKEIIGSNPDLPKTIIVEQLMNSLKQDLSSSTNSDINDIQSELNEINTIYELISELNIPEYRKAFKYKENFIKKFNEIEKYRANALQQTIAQSQAIDISSTTL